MWPPASPQPHVPGALHDVPDGTAARGLLAPPHLLQEFPAGWRRWRHHVGDEWLLQQRLLRPLQEDQASCCYSWNFSSQEEAARRYCTLQSLIMGLITVFSSLFFSFPREMAVNFSLAQCSSVSAGSCIIVSSFKTGHHRLQHFSVITRGVTISILNQKSIEIGLRSRPSKLKAGSKIVFVYSIVFRPPSCVRKKYSCTV